jgi:hypothetical protein
MKQFAYFIIGLLAAVVATMPAPAKQIILGPPDPGAERGGQWYNGTNGAGYRLIDDTDPNRGNNDFTLGNKTAGQENRADWRSRLFSLGPAAGGAEPITFSFAYKLPGEVKPGDDIAVFFRFFDDTGRNFLGQQFIPLGSSSGDSEMTGYKTVTLTGIRALKNATGVRLPKGARTAKADIWVTCNIFSPWTSGDARFDDFSVMTSRHFPLLKIAIPAVVLLGIAAALLLYFRRQKQ